MTIRQQFETIKGNKEQLDKFYKKYESIFTMKAKTLCNEIVKVLKENDKSLKVNPVHEVVGDYCEMQQREDKSSIYNGTISTSIAITQKGKVEKIVLVENSTATDEDAFRFGTYNVDIFNTLLNDNIAYADLIHTACWKAVAENLKEKLATKNKSIQI